MKQPKKTLIIDPKMFISGPYMDCPQCSKAATFGVLVIGGNRYTRRCKECWHTESFSLPALHKKLIYFDQFAISEMMKAINARLGKTEKVDKFWLKLFERLESLLSKQLILCPDSQFHERESLMSHYRALKRMYEHLSHGTSFYDPATIKRFQIAAEFQKHVKGKSAEPVALTARNIIHGNIDEWTDKFIISVNFPHSADDIEAIRKHRTSRHVALEQLTQRWRTEKNKNFEDRYRDEGVGYGRAMFQRYADGLLKYMQAHFGHTQLTGDELMAVVMGEEAVLVHSLQTYLPTSDLPDQHDKNTRTIGEFLQSEAMLTVPFNHIAALLWAGVAHRIANDAMRKAPNRGTVNDIEMVSLLLPYCDAMFVDKDIHSLLMYAPVKRGLKDYTTRVFSLSNKDQFMAYLDDIEAGADPEVIATAREVYGDSAPFTTMYEGEAHE